MSQHETLTPPLLPRPFPSLVKNDANAAAAAAALLNLRRRDHSAFPHRTSLHLTLPAVGALSPVPLVLLVLVSHPLSAVVACSFVLLLLLVLVRRRPLLLVAATLGATSKITASIDATTRLLDDPPMGRRREPRHPLGRGEREDRDRLKKQLQKVRERRRRRQQSSSSGRIKSGDGIGFEELEDIPFDENDEGFDGDQETAFVDTRAEAGGMGLLLVPLTPAGKPASPQRIDVHTCLQDFFRPLRRL